VADQLCLQGILYVPHNDIAWQLLPLDLRFGSGQTCWRRLERWQQARVFDRLHRWRTCSHDEQLALSQHVFDPDIIDPVEPKVLEEYIGHGRS